MFQTHADGFSTRANRRMDPAYQFDETFAWFVPGKSGDHDLKFGASIVHTPLHIYDASTLNGTFGFSATDLDFNAANPRTYPDRLTIRVPAPSDFIVTGTYHRRVRAGQVEDQQPPDGQRRRALGRGDACRSRRRTTRSSRARTTIRST